MFIIASPVCWARAKVRALRRVGELLVVLGDDPGAAAVGAVEFDQLDPEPLGDERHRAVQLGGEAARDAAGPVGDLDRLAIARLARLDCVSSGSGSIAPPRP